MPPYDINLGNPRESGTYSVYVYDEHLFDESAPFKPENLAGTFTFEIDYQIIGQPDDSNIVYPETPAEGSEQSGVGLVRGWACDAWRVEIQFDDGPRREVAYGTDRSDTREICGDDDNGYGLILAWGLLGHGGHTMRTYVNNELVDTVNFRVDGLDDPFLKGVSAEYTLEDFPAPGERVIVRWSEADQNFIIFDVQ